VLLHHFTSEQGARGIRASGVVETSLHHVLGEHFAWFTDQPAASATALGLRRRRIGRSVLTGDRMAHRLEVEVPDAAPWTEVRSSFTPQILSMLESAPGVRPDIWWVSRQPVLIDASRAQPRRAPRM
jgi:hypothetical protein